MNYGEYLHIQSQLERMDDFHPKAFDEISKDSKKLLSSMLLYDADDENYPTSIKDFYNDQIANNTKLQGAMLDAAQEVYDQLKAGDVREDMKDTISFLGN